MDYVFEISATYLVENTSKHSWDNFIVGLFYHSSVKLFNQCTLVLNGSIYIRTKEKSKKD